MKKYIIFAVSFLVLFLAFQILSGYFMTLFYVPDIKEAWNQADDLPSSVVIEGKSTFTHLFFAFLAAILAYYLSKVLVNKNKSMK